MKTVLYTCITSGYDERFPIVAKMCEFDRCVLFADDSYSAPMLWEKKKLSSPKFVSRTDLINRWHKFFSQDLFFDADVSVYIDGNIDIKQSVQPLVNKFIASNALFACFRHPQRSTVMQEYDACIDLRKFKHDDILRAKKQLMENSLAGFPADFPLCAAGVLFRRHGIGKHLEQAMRLWWKEVNRYTCRDQLSLPYVLWKTQLPFMLFDMDIFDNDYFMVRSHQSKKGDGILLSNKLRNMVRRAFGFEYVKY